MIEATTSNAAVIAVFPNKVRISVEDIAKFTDGKALRVGSYLRVSDNEDCALIAIIENFSIEVNECSVKKHIIEALPLGVIKEGKFLRGGDALTIPPTGVTPATEEDIKNIFEDSIEEKAKFTFASLASNETIKIPVNGNKFFNKHIAVVGSTGAGKSHAVTSILQKALSAKDGEYSLNNSHIVVFDIHSEYKTAFPSANFIDINNLELPYWLLNSDELEEILLDTGERDNYNQSSVFRNLVTENKKKHNPNAAAVFYDSPLKFDINEILNALYNIKEETVNAKNSTRYMISDDTYEIKDKDGKTEKDDGIELSQENRLNRYFTKKFVFYPTKSQSITKGDYADGTLDKFYTRFESKISQKRLEFLFGSNSLTATLEGTLQNFIGYGASKSNITIIDLSGVPFEVLSITVSLISRIIFEYGYHYKVLRTKNNEEINNDAPILLVYEEAHKYVPNSDLSKFRASKQSIERIAKEGRKYGVTLLLASQRPSEISETIFSQCNNFIAMRLTNPNDQNYVSKLLPDSLGNLVDKMSTLGAGDALLIGDSVIMPSIVKIEQCNPTPSSNDIPYLKLWKQEWKDIDFNKIKLQWLK